MIMSNPINGAHEIYNVGSNAILAAYTLGQFPSPWTFAATCAAAAGLCTVSTFADATPATVDDPTGMLCGR